MKNYYKIGEISKLYGIGADSLRYYEELGVLRPKRDQNGYRLYNLKDMYKLNIIRDLRLLGFSMAQIKEYLDGQSIANTLKMLEDEQSLLQQKIDELREKQSIIRRRMASLNAAKNIRPGIFAVKTLPERRCVQLSQHITRDEEMDFVIKKLHKKHESMVPDLVNQTVGAFFSMDDWRQGRSNVYQSIFFVLENSTADYDFVLPAGDYLSCFYQGNYQQNGRRIQEVLTFAAAQGIPVAGEPFELYEIDNRYTIREHEFLTEIQIQVLK